ncbi:uncharacterized protein LOC144124366 [Amblyomma americanum]
MQSYNANTTAKGEKRKDGVSPVTVGLLVLLIPVLIGVALGIRYTTRGPRVVTVARSESTPAGGDKQPDGGDKKPDGGDKKPDGGDKKPDGGDKKPDGGDKKPDGGDKKPDGGDKKPDGGDKKPDGGDKKPDGGDKKPDGGDKKPDGGDKKPDGGDKKPDGGDKKPDGGDKKPDGGDKKPDGGDKKPDGGDKKPDGGDKKPDGGDKKPDGGDKKPDGGDKKPDGGDKKPDGGDKKPDGGDKKPDGGDKKPDGGDKKPDGGDKKPDGGDKKPDGGDKKPDGGDKKPDGGDKKPDGGDKKPDGGDKKPDGGDKKPDGGDKKPDGGDKQPDGGDKKPDGGDKKPDGGDKKPDGGDKKPDGGDKKPDGGDKKPDGGDKKPDGGDKKPDGGDKKPDGGDKKPDGGDKKPDGGDKKPDGGDKKPDGGDKKPDGGDKKPDGGDKKPDGGDKKIDTNPSKQEIGKETHDGPLLADVKPTRYAVTLSVTGPTLGSTLQVKGRVEATLKPAKDTNKLVLKAKASASENLLMALVDSSGGADKPPLAVAITSVSPSKDFLVVLVTEPLKKDKTYTLITEHEYKSSGADGPITLDAALSRMELKAGEAHAVFPCFEESGWTAAVQLTLRVPKDVIALSNAAVDGQPVSETDATVYKFKETLDMTLDKLAWVLLPKTMKKFPIIPNVVDQYGANENEDLKDGAKKSFEFLTSFLEPTKGKLVQKLDVVVGAVDQDSLGLLVVKEFKKETICTIIAGQWFRHLLPQTKPPTWFAKAGAEYLCLLATTEDTGMLKAFKSHLEKCVTGKGDSDTMELLAFRMAHFIMGDGKMKEDIQKFLKDHLFQPATNEQQLAAFEPTLPKANLEPWLTYCCKTVTVERTPTPAKLKVTWEAADAADAKATPFATGAKGGVHKLKSPAAVAVQWLGAANAEAPLAITDKDPLLVNPAVMACYGIKQSVKAWALIGHSAATTPLDDITAWYLLHQSQKQYGEVKVSADIAGAMWMWETLKPGNPQLWDAVAEQLLATELEAFSLLTTDGDESTYKTRVGEIIDERLKKIDKTKDLKPQSKTKTAAVVAHLACLVGKQECATLLDATLIALNIDDQFEKSVEAATSVPPDAVACHLGSRATDAAGFDGKITSQSAPIKMVLAFASCAPKTVPEGSIIKVADRALKTDDLGDIKVRTSTVLRQALLKALDTITQSDAYKKALKNLATLRAVRTEQELTDVKTKAMAHKVQETDHLIEDLKKTVVADLAPLKSWIAKTP